MRRSRKRREQFTVSLFPFLAVLICTMGVLIVLLVLAVKSADVEAHKVRESHQEKSQAEIDRLKLELDTEQLRIVGLKQVRPEAVKRMSDVRTLRGHLEDDIRQLNHKARELAAQLAELEKQSDLPDTATTDAEIAELETKVASAKQKLESTRRASQVQKPKTYAIVPQPGSGGTHRRPIYIECTNEGLTLQPHDVLLSRHDFVEPFLPGNPLDAALLAIREYWTKYDLAGKNGHPYPLLVIRPSGTNSYVVARRAMTSWDSEFGYEVIEDDKLLEFGEHDAQLKQIIETAIENAKKQHAYVALVRERRSRLTNSSRESEDRRPGLIVSGPKGGFVSANGFTSNERSSNAAYSQDDSNTNSYERQASFAANQPSKQIKSFGSVLDRYLDQPTIQSPRKLLTNSQSAASHRTSEHQSLATSSKSNTPPTLSTAGRGQPQHNKKTSPAGVTGSPGSSGNSKCPCLADDRGQNWALPSRTPGATGYLRPVRIFCGPNALQLQTTRFHRVTIPFDGSTENAVTALVDNIWQQIESWGEAGANGYWKPELRFTILPGGGQRFEDLKSLLNNSGFLIGEPQ